MNRYEPSTSLNDYTILEDAQTFAPGIPDSVLEPVFEQSASLRYPYDERLNWILLHPRVFPYVNLWNYATWRLESDNPGVPLRTLVEVIRRNWNQNNILETIRLADEELNPGFYSSLGKGTQ